jgi:glycosyltransferase involved in cell wall biosynthesis
MTGVPFVELKRLGSPGLLRMRTVRRLAADLGVDVVHGNLWQSNLYSRMAVVGRHNRPAVVISERNVEAERSWTKRWLDARLAGVTDAYVGNTEMVSEFIRRVHPVGSSPVITIPNAVDTTVFHPVAVQRPAATEPVIGSVGRLDPEKGFDVLIDAVRAMGRRGVKARLRIAGVGPLHEDLIARAKGVSCELVGRLQPGHEVAEFLRSLDVFCLPSTFREGRPNVVLEALAVGLPVVTTAIAGMTEILDEQVLVPPGDAAALAEALVAAASDPTEWRDRANATPVYDFDTLARRYLDVFRSACGR